MMKINKIYISAFGGLKDFTLELNDGLNVIYGNNEDGKSTVAAFIKAMFFGTGRKSQSMVISTRQKYTPWDGSAMAGRIYFEHQNKKYCLEREFRKSDSTDRILLTDLDSGKNIDAGENIGQRFFGMSAAAFERSLFIGTGGDFAKDGAAAGEINAKLSNIAVTGVEDISYQKIQKTLSNAKGKVISKTGRAGSYAEDLRALEELKDRLIRADEDAVKKSELNENIAVKRAEYETLYKKYAELKAVTDRENDFKNREKLEEYLEIKRQLDLLNDSMRLSDGTLLDESFASKIDFGIGKHEKAEERCRQISNDIANLKETISLQNQNSPENAKEQIGKLTADAAKLTEQKDRLEQSVSALNSSAEELKTKLITAQSKKMAFNPLLLTLSVISALAAAVIAFSLSQTVAAIALGAVSAILLILTFIIRPKNTSAAVAVQGELAEANTALAEAKADKNRVQEEINNINARINTLSSVLNADAAVKAQNLAYLTEKTEAFNAESEKRDIAKTELLRYLSGFDDLDSIEKIKECLADIKRKTEQQKNLKLKLKVISQFLGNIDYEQAAEKLSKLKENQSDMPVDIEKAKAELELTAEKLSQIKESLTVIATELKTSFKNSENPEDLKRKINECNERLNSKKDFCDSIDTALSVLEESFYEIRRGYGSEIENLTHSIFASLTDGRYKSVTVSDTLEISVEQADVFGTRELDFLSLGTTHQAYLSLRLAIAKLIAKDDTLPLFLDDSLSQYDDTRAKRAVQFLKDYCESGQGVLFTCHRSICDIAANQGVEIQNPYK